MWSCRQCGRTFANANQWHACTDLSVEDRLAEESAEAVALYRTIVAELESHGPFRIHPQRSRIAFIATMTFASVRFARSWVDLSLITAKPIASDRVRAVDLYGPTTFDSTVRLSAVAQVDDDLRTWLGHAYARGIRKTLDSHASVGTVRDPIRDVLRVPLVARVGVEPDGTRYLIVPAYAAEALGHRSDVTVDLAGGGRVLAMTERDGTWHTIVGIDSALATRGLGDGDDVEVVLRPVVL